MATHDYVIDNSTGANVRADLNLVLQAILSNNSSSSAPSTTAAYMWWADTTTGILKIRNSANNAWVELLQLDGTLTLEDGSASTPALAFRDDLNTGIFSSAADTFNVATGGVERMELGTATVFNEDGADVDFRIEGDTEANLFYVDAGNDQIGIGATVPRQKLHIGASDSGSVNMVFTNSTTGNSAGDGFVVGITGGEDAQLNMQESANLKFSTADTERMRIDSSGRVLIGVSSARTGVAGMGDPLIQHEGLNSDDSAVSFIRNSNSAFGGSLILGKTRGTSVGANTLVQNGDDIFTIRFVAGDGTDINSEVATIKAEIDNVASANDVPGRLVFATTADGASAPTERMRIDSSGDVLVGNYLGGGTNQPRVFFLSEDGNFPDQVNQLGLRISNGYADAAIRAYGNSSSWTHVKFYSTHLSGGSITTAGSISMSGGNSIAYNTSSDYRLKENQVLISDGITRLKQLKPYRFNWKTDTSKKVDGFFAHEAATVVPEAVTGEKDAVVTQTMIDAGQIDEAIGTPVYQGIDQAKLVPLLVAAVKELITKVETLEAA